MTSLFVIVHLEISNWSLQCHHLLTIYTQTYYNNHDNSRQRKPHHFVSTTVAAQKLLCKQTCLVIYQIFWYLWFYVHEFPNWTLIYENNSSSTAPESQEIVFILQFTAGKRLQMHKVISWVFLFRETTVFY